MTDAEYEALILELGKRVAAAMIEENSGYHYGQDAEMVHAGRWRGQS